MKDLDYELQVNYFDAVDSLKCKRKGELMKLYNKTEHTRAKRKIIGFYAVLIVLMCILAVGAGAIGATAAGFDIAELVYKKTENTTLDDQEKMEIATRLDSMYADGDGYTSQTMEQLENLPDLQTNEYGLSYGAMQLAPDLFGVENDQNTAYCYTSDFQQASGLNITDPVEYMQKKENGLWRNWIFAYESDGKTIVGKFLIGDGGFYTNEQLENEEVQVKLIDGEDINEYEEMAAERSQSLTEID